MVHIDLKTILQQTVASIHGDLVTRRTGRAVRGGIEETLATRDGEQLAVIDFSAVRCLDISCADEIVGKLLRRHGRARYFLLNGVTMAHCEAIEPVLERYGVAVAARDREGRLKVLGPVEETARRAFSLLSQNGPAEPEDIAQQLRVPTDTAEHALEALQGQRLVHRAPQGYRTVAQG